MFAANVVLMLNCILFACVARFCFACLCVYNRAMCTSEKNSK